MPRAQLPTAGQPVAHAGSYVDRTRRLYLRRKKFKVAIKAAAVSAGWYALGFLSTTSPRLLAFGLAGLAAIWTVAAVFIAQVDRRAAPFDQVPSETATRRVPPRGLTDEELAVAQVLKKEAGTVSRCYTLWQRWLTCTAIVAASLLFVLEPKFEGSALLSLPVTCGLGGLMMRRYRIAGDNAADDVRATLEEAGPAAAGAIIDFIKSSDSAFHYDAHGALKNVLDRFRASDGPALRAEHRRYLYDMLRWGRESYNPEVAQAVLHVIEQLADRDAEPYLLEIISRGAPQELVAGAFRALESIGQADVDLGKRGSLLSPAMAPDDPSETLLRATGGGSGGSPDELLRATATPDEA